MWYWAVGYATGTLTLMLLIGLMANWLVCLCSLAFGGENSVCEHTAVPALFTEREIRLGSVLQLRETDETASVLHHFLCLSGELSALALEIRIRYVSSAGRKHDLWSSGGDPFSTD